MKTTDLSPQEALEYRFDGVNISPFEWIVDRQYRCMIPRSMLNYMDQDKWREDYLSLDPEYDKRYANARIPAYITIEHMLNIWDNGLSFRLCNDSESKEIYEVLSLHIRACLLHNQDPFRGDAVNLSVLKKMDDFLSDMFPNFRVSISKEEYRNDDARDVFNRKVGLISKSKLESTGAQQHKSLIGQQEINDNWVNDTIKDDLSDFDFGGEEWH